MKKFNAWLAQKLAYWLATVAMFYAVTFLTLSILFFQTPQSALEWVQYSVQTFFQGVALPVLAFVAKISGERQEKILQETHDTVMAELSFVKDELVELKALHRNVGELIAEIHARTKAEIESK
ncbi:MAG: hypothetical protein WCV63_07655 [Negativicutes bacterium]